MSYCSTLIALLSMIAVLRASASGLSAPITPVASKTHRNPYSQTTPPPNIPSILELRKREDKPGRTCGWLQKKDGSWDTWSVLSPYFCAGTILPDGSAYAFSSDAEVGSQYMVYTTAVGNWDSKKPCPTEASTTCCSGNNPVVQTYYFVASTYTITSWWCSSTRLTQTWNPATNLLDTIDFSTSLAQATASSTSSPVVSSSGLSAQTKIGIGVGVAGGAGAVLLAGAALFFCRRRQKRVKRTPEGALQTPYTPSVLDDPQVRYSPPTWHSEPRFDYCQQDRHLSPWPTPPSRIVRLNELHGEVRTGEVQELPGETKTGKLQEQGEWPRQELSADL